MSCEETRKCEETGKYEVTGKYEALDNCEILGEGFLMEELKSTVPPIVSIISKCEKAQSKYEKGTAQFRRYEKIIHAMKVSKTYWRTGWRLQPSESKKFTGFIKLSPLKIVPPLTYNRLIRQ